MKNAQKYCSEWHGGQWSALYQYASSGIYTIENHLRYLQEIESALHPEYNLHPGTLSKKSERELTSLKNFFINQGLKNGIETAYRTHQLYGYLIPYISNETELIDKVTQLQYPI